MMNPGEVLHQKTQQSPALRTLRNIHNVLGTDLTLEKTEACWAEEACLLV